MDLTGKLAGEDRRELRSTTEIMLQLFGVFGAPIVWALEFVFSYSITQHACSTGRYWQLYLLSAVAIALAALALWVAVRAYRMSPSVGSDGSSAMARTRFMALLGLLTSGFFLVVIFAEAIPRFILSPCE